MKEIKMLLLASMVMLFTACGGGSSSGGTAPSNPIDPETPQTIAIAKIMLYANDNNRPAPTVEDYANAGVTGVTADNIDDVNEVVASLTSSEVDTPEEIQKIVNNLGINILPTANAGPDKNAEVNQAVTVTGSGTDIDGTIVSYEWKKGTVVLAATASFDYIPIVAGTDTLTLTVMDDDGDTATDSMTVTVTEAPPPAPDLISITITIPDTIEESTSESLSAVGNYSDTSNKDITNLVTWSSSNTSIASISGSMVTGKSEGDVTITAELDGMIQSAQIKVTPYIWWNHLSVRAGSGSSVIINGYVQSSSWKDFSLVNESTSSSLQVIRLYGTDGYGQLFLNQALSENLSVGQGVGYRITLSNDVYNPIISYEVKDKDTGIIKTFSVTWTGTSIPPPNTPPVANAGSDLSVQVNKTITITGSGTDDGTITLYEWRKGTILLASTAAFDYTPDTVGTDTLTLTVTDNEGATASDTMVVTVTDAPSPNNPPVADAGAEQNVYTASTVTLDGSASSDPDDDLLTYQWSFSDKPAGSNAQLINPTADKPTFTADKDGNYIVELIVNDGKVNSDESLVVVTAETLNMVPLWINRERTFNDGIINEKSLSIDSDNNIYTSGEQSYTSAGAEGNYIKKVNSHGELLWKTYIGNPDSSEFCCIYVRALTNNSNDDLYVAGFIVNNNTPYVGKLNSDGVLLWTHQDANVMGIPNALVSDSNDNFYVTGGTDLALDGNTHSGDKDIFITKFNRDGVWQWTRQYGTSGFDEAYALTIDNDGYIYVTGRISSTLDGSDIFISKFNSDGTKIWTRQSGTISYDASFAIGADSQNNIYISGRVNDSLDGNTHNGKADIFLSKYNNNGTKVWSKQFGTAEEDGTRGLDIDSNDNIYITGTMGGSDFLNYRDGGYFISRFNANGDKLWTEYHEENGYGFMASAIGVDSDNEVYIAGNIYNQDPNDDHLNWYHYYEHFLTKYGEE